MEDISDTDSVVSDISDRESLGDRENMELNSIETKTFLARWYYPDDGDNLSRKFHRRLVEQWDRVWMTGEDLEGIAEFFTKTAFRIRNEAWYEGRKNRVLDAINVTFGSVIKEQYLQFVDIQDGYLTDEQITIRHEQNMTRKLGIIEKYSRQFDYLYNDWAAEFDWPERTTTTFYLSRMRETDIGYVERNNWSLDFGHFVDHIDQIKKKVRRTNVFTLEQWESCVRKMFDMVILVSGFIDYSSQRENVRKQLLGKRFMNFVLRNWLNDTSEIGMSGMNFMVVLSMVRQHIDRQDVSATWRAGQF